MGSRSLTLNVVVLVIVSVAGGALRVEAGRQTDQQNKEQSMRQRLAAAAATRPSTAPATTRPARLPFADAAEGTVVLFPQPRQWDGYDAMHKYFVEGFVKSEGFGMSRMPTPRQMARQNTLYLDGESYRIGTVELLSLDNDPKTGKPFAYSTPGDAAKDRLEKAKHRPLRETEAAALAQLREGKQTVLAADAAGPVLVGAVRASADCLKCHSVKEGELLGAFSYPLVLVEEAAKNPPTTRPTARIPTGSRP